MACRGNATSFPLPWQDLLVQLKNNDHAVATKDNVLLPRAGSELGNVVSILLKTAGTDCDDASTARLIHQARVRRSVVIDLLEEMKNRGHRAYDHVDMHIVRRRAIEGLPADDVPPEK